MGNVLTRRRIPPRFERTPRPKVGSSERGSVGSQQAYILAYETACCQYASITACWLTDCPRLATADFGSRDQAASGEIPDAEDLLALQPGQLPVKLGGALVGVVGQTPRDRLCP